MSSRDIPTRERVHVGRITGVHGIKGWVKVQSFTEPREAVLQYQPWLVGDTQAEMKVIDAVNTGRKLLVRLDGVDARAAAEGLAGSEIAVWREDLPQLTDMHYYWADLVGLTVRNLQGFDFGRISAMIATGANDVMVVQGRSERLIPFVVGPYVKQVDLEGRQVLVDWDPEF